MYVRYPKSMILEEHAQALSVHSSLSRNVTWVVHTNCCFHFYFYFLLLLLQLFSFSHATHRTDVLTNYAKWQLIQRYLPYLDDPCLNAYLEFRGATTLSPVPQNRSEMCIEMAWRDLTFAMTRLFVDFALPEDSRVRITLLPLSHQNVSSILNNAHLWPYNLQGL